MGKIKPQALLQQSKKKKGPNQMSAVTIAIYGLIVVVMAFFLFASYRHWNRRSKFQMEDMLSGVEHDSSRVDLKNVDVPKYAPIDVLFEEIKEINQRFLEVKVDVMSRDDVSRRGFDEGILIHCSYVPVGPASQYMIHKLLPELVVPADYPAFSPTVSENMSRGCGDSEEGKYLWRRQS